MTSLREWLKKVRGYATLQPPADWICEMEKRGGRFGRGKGGAIQRAALTKATHARVTPLSPSPPPPPTHTRAPTCQHPDHHVGSGGGQGPDHIRESRRRQEGRHVVGEATERSSAPTLGCTWCRGGEGVCWNGWKGWGGGREGAGERVKRGVGHE